MGNILTQKRHKRDGTQIEDMTYRYKYDVNNKLLRNRLYHVNDVIAANVDDTDIDDMGAFVSNPLLIETANNYSYDEEGRLIKDTQEGIELITWRVDGKVKSIERPLNSGKKNVSFDYNAFGNRIAKHVFDDNWNLEKSTYYILDAQGNQLSMYEHTVDSNQVNFTLAERNIYGSSRLGRTNLAVNMYSSTPEAPINEVLGHRNYELSNHLGNVLTVINDIKIPLSDDNETVSEYQAGIVSISDYSPFGVQLDGRTLSAEGYRYGFNGMEKDDEVKGMGNSYTTEFRQYDARLGRWLSLDPLMMIFPAESPYNSFANNPIFFNDPYGLAPTNEGGPEKVTLKGDNREYTSEYLPKTAENGQIIEIEFDSHKLINTFSAEKQQWNTVIESVNSATGATELSGGTWQDGWLDEMPQGTFSSNQNTSITKSNSTTVENIAESVQKKTVSSPTVDILSRTIAIGGVVAKIVETSADDMAKPPKYASKSIPNKKAWEPISKVFKTASKVGKYVGNLFGIVSAGINFTASYDKWKSGDKWGATKAAFKGIVDVGLIALKTNPIGLAVSIGWAVFSSWW